MNIKWSERILIILKIKQNIKLQNSVKRLIRKHITCLSLYISLHISSFFLKIKEYLLWIRFQQKKFYINSNAVIPNQRHWIFDPGVLCFTRSQILELDHANFVVYLTKFSFGTMIGLFQAFELNLSSLCQCNGYGSYSHD